MSQRLNFPWRLARSLCTSRLVLVYLVIYPAPVHALSAHSQSRSVRLPLFRSPPVPPPGRAAAGAAWQSLAPTRTTGWAERRLKAERLSGRYRVCLRRGTAAGKESKRTEKGKKKKKRKGKKKKTRSSRGGTDAKHAGTEPYRQPRTISSLTYRMYVRSQPGYKKKSGHEAQF
ncbi:uncharacterized protein J3D65DRAFT_445327 [Phyllosticta citribraziliensis]|uniref:Uncharacterized protein n=1 Tax=Phyllosticta citribraziliensis TaxID=989973 RepID=A0ABR1LJ54_9PEZI